jgi:hypothetical protein
MDIELIKLIIDGVVALIFAVGAYVLIPYIQEMRKNKIIDSAVKAAEKMFKEAGSGAQKKEYVINFLIEKKIVKRDENGEIPIEINILIEAAVKELDKLMVKDEG